MKRMTFAVLCITIIFTLCCFNATVTYAYENNSYSSDVTTDTMLIIDSHNTNVFTKAAEEEDYSVAIVVDTVIQGGDNLPLDGYLYGLYHNGSLIQSFPVSDINGESVLTLNYSEADVGNSIDYTVKQIVPELSISDMAYSDKEYKITVKIMSDVGAYIVSGNENAQQTHLTFINEYISKPVDDIADIGEKNIKQAAVENQGEEALSQNSSPFTTEGNGVIIWIILSVATATIIVILVYAKKRKTVN